MSETAMIVVGLATIIGGCTAVVFEWSRMPWPRRVRWLVATNALGYWGMATEPIMMREVFVVDLWSGDDHHLGVVVRAWGSASSDTTLVATGATITTSAQVARWRAAGTPLLLVSDGTGSVSLHGPTRVMSDLAVEVGGVTTRFRSPTGAPPVREQEHPL